MRQTRFFVYAIVTTLIVLGGCHNASNDMNSSAPTQLGVTATPNPAYAGSPVSFSVSAYNDHLALRSIRIDYTNDGTWDDTRTINRSSATETFGFTYATPGNYSVKVEVTDANDGPQATTLPVVVRFANSIDVSYKLFGSSGTGGDCGAMGPPATCLGCDGVLLGADVSNAVSGHVGTFTEGTEVRVSQNFVQNPYSSTRNLYSCQFMMVLIEKTQDGGQHDFAAGSCSTSSVAHPANLSCNVDIKALLTSNP